MKSAAGHFDLDCSYFYRVLKRFERRRVISKDASYLVLFGGDYDRHVLSHLGYRNVTFTNITPSQATTGDSPSIDASRLPFPNGSFDFAVAHAGVHHASRPHGAVCEMYRVARRAVIFVESQDSWLMRLAVRAGLVAEYEWNAILDHDFKRGGVDDRPIPNYVYRWTRREVEKLARALEPEREPIIHFVAEWDFHYRRVARRLKGTPIGLLPDWLLEPVCAGGVALANAAVGKYGNAFCVCIEKGGALKPWIRTVGGRLEFDAASVGGATDQ
jgi:SAM-dependent methyltransferase